MSGDKTMLQILEDASIISIMKLGEDSFELTEACDNYFTINLSREMVLQLAKELTELAGEPKP